jgi:hypothetical protein
MESTAIGRFARVPTSAVLSPTARLVLGCLEILAVPSLDGLTEVTGLSTAEVKRCIVEIRAVGESAAESV